MTAQIDWDKSIYQYEFNAYESSALIATTSATKFVRTGTFSYFWDQSAFAGIGKVLPADGQTAGRKAHVCA